MRRTNFVLAASCIVAATGLLLALASSGTVKASSGKIIYSFQGGSDGDYPLSDLILDSAGNLYGTTDLGGTGTACNGGCGTVFRLQRTSNGWKEQVLYSFAGGADGINPEAGLIFDSSGNLYGTTANGGGGGGTVFKLALNSKGGWTESVIHSFNCQSEGCNPQTDLSFDAHGNLFSTMSVGPTGGPGAVFELMPQSNGSWKETTIYEFKGPPDGSMPSSPVALDSQGDVFGMTEFGGSGTCLLRSSTLGCGIVYELTPNSGGWTETVIHNFTRGGGFGVNPSTGFFQDKAGHLFGTTVAGGNGFGSVFELDLSQKKGKQQTVVHRFYGNPDGKGPTGQVAMNANGAMFGATGGGGANRSGTVFELSFSQTTGWRERLLHTFAGGTDGLAPFGGVVSDAQGHIYGTTSFGGTGTACRAGCGTVYEVTP
jgi:uncharacterized repeat protein (TIGR03803 family)